MLNDLLENGTHKRSYQVFVGKDELHSFIDELLEVALSPKVTKHDAENYSVEFEVWVERGATEDD